RPDLVKAKDITENGTVLIDYAGKESRFLIVDELSVTNALLKALRDEDYVLILSPVTKNSLALNKRLKESPPCVNASRGVIMKSKSWTLRARKKSLVMPVPYLSSAQHLPS